MATKLELEGQNTGLQDQLKEEKTAHGRTARRANAATGVAVAAGLIAIFEGGVILSDGASKPAAIVRTSDGGMPSSSLINGTDIRITPAPSAQTALESVMPSASAKKTEGMNISFAQASKDVNGNWVVNSPDGKADNIKAVEGFTPDGSLVLAPEWGKALKLDPAKFADFQKSLNDPKHPLVGYTYGENDQSNSLDYRRTLQASMFSWTVMTGEEVFASGIGNLKGGPGRAVELIIMNIDGTVGDFGPKNPVMIKHGFTGTGRIWDGGNVVEDERGISSHYVSRLEEGVTLPGESGFIGQCDIKTNCNEVLVVSVIRRQWGQNPDGSNRYQYQLLREELVTKVTN